MKDKKILELIQSGERAKAFDAIYKHYPKVLRMILSKGGSEEDAKDLFQESVIIFYKNVLKVDFMLTSAISTYLYSIAHNLWLKKIRDVYSKETNMSDHIQIIHEEPDMEEQEDFEEKREVMLSALKSLSDKCVQLLKLYYFKKQNMKNIAETMGYSNDKIAKNQKYKCMEKMREIAIEQYKLKQESVA